MTLTSATGTEPCPDCRRIGAATLYLADCADVLPGLEGVDHVISDPPYSERTHTGALTNKIADAGHKYRHRGAKLINFDCWTVETFDAFARACLAAASRWVIMTCDFECAAHVLRWEECVRQGVYVKRAPMPQISGDRPGQGHEAVICLHNPGKKRWNGGGRAAVWTATVIKDPSVVKVPSQKPLELIEQFVRDFTEPGDLVCDPCMGSGTTGVACLRAGRRFAGIEKDPEHFRLACERIARAEKQPDMFTPKIEQEALDL